MSRLASVLLTIVLTGAIVGAVVYNYGVNVGSDRQAAVLQERIDELESDNKELHSKVTELEEGLAKAENNQINRRPHAGWDKYFPSPDTCTLLGEPIEKVRDLLGNPPFLIRSIAVNSEFNREIWVYTPYEEAPTGLYLYFRGDKLVRSRLDEFNGLAFSGLLDDPDFWM